MTDDKDKKPLRRTIRGGRSFFFADPATDKVLNMVVTLGSEVWALRERLAAVEAIQVQRGQLGSDEVDGYEFTAEQELRLAADRKEFIDNLFRILQEQVEVAASRATRGGARAGKRTGRSARQVNGEGGRSAKRSLLFGARGAKAKSPRASARSEGAAGRSPTARRGAKPRAAAKSRGVVRSRRGTRR